MLFSVRRSVLAAFATVVPLFSVNPTSRAFALAAQNGEHLKTGIAHIPLPTSYVNATTAAAIDVDLMQIPGFSIDQLMELAGLSVASAVHDYYSTTSTVPNVEDSREKRVLLLCGPGNNGGDGLVAARHLHHFGYKPVIVYPKSGRSNPILYKNLVKQCQDLGIEVISDPSAVTSLTEQVANGTAEYDIVVDALFGFSFEGQAREPYASLISAMTSSSIPTISVDIPSGWHVDQGDLHHTKFNPSALISLTTPKKCAQNYTGAHYVGGRFVPPDIAQKHNLEVPSYGYNTAQIAKYTSNALSCENANKATNTENVGSGL